MKKKIKRYLVFTSLPYRIAVFIMIPVLFTGIGAYAGSLFGVQGMMFAAGFLTMVEIISDHWLFFGLQAKESEKAEFLKTSGMGMEMIQDALILDLVRKFLTATGIAAACYLITGLQGGFLYIVLVSYAFSALGTFLSRYGGMLLLNIVIAQFAMMFVTASLSCMLQPGLLKSMFGTEFFFLALGILVSILTVMKAMQKVKGSYYDE